MTAVAPVRADVVVVGGGGSGAVVAARLAKDSGRSVVLLEAGPAPRDIPRSLRDAGSVEEARPDGDFAEGIPSRLADGRDFTIVRGRVLGGSTSINGAYFIRPRRADFERWSNAGGAEWGFAPALPVLRDLEADADYGAGDLHGADGPMPVERSVGHPGIAAAFAAAARRGGHPDEPDKNGDEPAGVGPVPRNVRRGVRVSTALAYLREGVRGPVILDRARATRLLLEGGRVRGVEFVRDGRPQQILAEHVVLAGGALGSPRLLLSSGIGPAGDLKRAGIPVVLDAPGVGAAISDHPQVTLEWEPKPLEEPEAGTWMAGVLNVERGPDAFEILASSRSMRSLLSSGPRDPAEPLPVFVADQSPERRGSLRIVSADPAAPLEIDFGYLSTAADRRRLREAVRLTAGLLGSREFSAVSRGVVGLATTTLRDDAALDGWIRDRIGTAFHSCGTVPFGRADDPHAVVDGTGRVQGVDGLRVADLSILPTAPVRGPSLSAVMIGERVVADLRG